MSETSTALQTCPPCAAMSPTSQTVPVQDIEVTAQNADEMAQAQTAIIAWCKNKIAEMVTEAKELRAAYEHAHAHKWRSDTLKRHSEIAAKRLDFYQRMLAALEHGYQIVPSFPITAFAIRTNRNKPLQMYTTEWSKKHTQEPPSLPAGEGEYKNPFPLVLERTIEDATQTKSEVVGYWAEAWKDLEFPLSMAKPRIMAAATRAMALKIFDDLGILPGYAANEGTRPPRGDPIIVARLKDPRPVAAWQTPRYITFIVAWHLNTKTL